MKDSIYKNINEAYKKVLNEDRTKFIKAKELVKGDVIRILSSDKSPGYWVKINHRDYKTHKSSKEVYVTYDGKQVDSKNKNKHEPLLFDPNDEVEIKL